MYNVILCDNCLATTTPRHSEHWHPDTVNPEPFTGATPYPCEWCGKRVRQLSVLHVPYTD